MKKIGILFGKERSFPMAFVERFNSKAIPEISAEPVHISKALQGLPCGYIEIVLLARTGIIHSPSCESVADKYYNDRLMTRFGIGIPKKVILKSRELLSH